MAATKHPAIGVALAPCAAHSAPRCLWGMFVWPNGAKCRQTRIRDTGGGAAGRRASAKGLGTLWIGTTHPKKRRFGERSGS